MNKQIKWKGGYTDIFFFNITHLKAVYINLSIVPVHEREGLEF